MQNKIMQKKIMQKKIMQKNRASKQFERFTAELYQKRGKYNVQQNLWLVKKINDTVIRREIDITYGIKFAGIQITSTGYIECKYKENSPKCNA